METTLEKKKILSSRLYWPAGVEQRIPAVLHSIQVERVISLYQFVFVPFILVLTRQRALPPLPVRRSHIILSLYYSLRPFMHSSIPVSHWTPTAPPMQAATKRSPAYIHPSIPPSCLPNPFNLALHPLCPVLSSPPERFIPLSQRTEDIHYLKWSRVNIKGAAVGSVPPSLAHPLPALSPQYFCLSIIRLQHYERCELHQPCRWARLPLP